MDNEKLVWLLKQKGNKKGFKGFIEVELPQNNTKNKQTKKTPPKPFTPPKENKPKSQKIEPLFPELETEADKYVYHKYGKETYIEYKSNKAVLIDSELDRLLGKKNKIKFDIKKIS